MDSFNPSTVRETRWPFARLLAKWTFTRQPAERHLRLIETLPLGPKKQLMLVSCDGERFLVGSGADSVHTIVRISSDHASESR